MIVIVGDLKESRRIKARAQFAADLEDALQHISDHWRSYWYAPLISTRGIDELSGVLVSPKPVFEIISFINERIWPSQFRFAVFEGKIDVALGSRDASAMDGPAFHSAAQQIEVAREQEMPLKLTLNAALSSCCRLVEATVLLYATMLADSTERQIEALKAYRQTGTQRRAAKKLGVKPQTVQAHLAKMHFSELERVRNQLNAFFAALEKA